VPEAIKGVENRVREALKRLGKKWPAGSSWAKRRI
jgi:hypothetical protein